MKLVALYDIHGNLPALDAVLAEITGLGVDAIVVGGDVLPGPFPGETIDRLLHLNIPVHFIQGNGERDVLALLAGQSISVPEPFLDAMRWTGKELAADQIAHIRRWPATVTLDMPELGKVQFCHATPQRLDAVFTEVTPVDRVSPAFQNVDATVVICGHTHMPFDRRIGTCRVVNAGSVGMPYGSPGAHWLLLAAEIQFRCTIYEREQAARTIRSAKYPGADQFAANHVLTVPDKRSMIELFEKRALLDFPERG